VGDPGHATVVANDASQWRQGRPFGDYAGVSARGRLSLERHTWIGDGEATNGESAGGSCQDSRV
jgi:hypothetical protein